jgi:hypothetical protein
MNHKTAPPTYLVVAIVALCLLVSAGPTLVALMNAAIPLVAVAGVVAVVLRLVFFHTRRW